MQHMRLLFSCFCLFLTKKSNRLLSFKLSDTVAFSQLPDFIFSLNPQTIADKTVILDPFSPLHIYNTIKYPVFSSKKLKNVL